MATTDDRGGGSEFETFGEVGTRAQETLLDLWLTTNDVIYLSLTLSRAQ